MSREALMSQDCEDEVRAFLAARGVQLRAYELDGDVLRIRVVLPPLPDLRQVTLHFDEPEPVELPARYAGCSCDCCITGVDCGCDWCTKEHARELAYQAEVSRDDT